MRFEIDSNIFEYFPGMRVAAVVAKGLSERTCDAEGIDISLREAWKSAAAAAAEYGNPQSHPYIKPWVEHMKGVGASRKKYPSSIESLVRRAGKSDTPVRISPVVDFYNAVSLKHLAPAGGYDIDQLKGDLKLRFSKEGDTFQALDSEEVIGVPAGEVSYADGNIIITRHFLWKQAKHTLLTAGSENILFVSEILGELPKAAADEVGAAVCGGLKEYFGIDSRLEILDVDHSGIDL